MYVYTLKQLCCHIDEIFITDCTKSYEKGNFDSASDTNLIQMATFPFLCIFFRLPFIQINLQPMPWMDHLRIPLHKDITRTCTFLLSTFPLLYRAERLNVSSQPTKMTGLLTQACPPLHRPGLQGPTKLLLNKHHCNFTLIDSPTLVSVGLSIG